MSDRTIVLLKPDAVERKLVSVILSRIENMSNVSIRQMKLVKWTQRVAKEFYEEHTGKMFFFDLTTFMATGPMVTIMLWGPDVLARWRQAMGSAVPPSDCGTIRANLRVDGDPLYRNLVHGSDSERSFEREYALLCQYGLL